MVKTEVNDKPPVFDEPEVTTMETPPAKVSPAISPEVLANIMALLESQGEELKTLRNSVNANKLAEVEKSKKPVGPPTVHLKILNGKPVIKWAADKTIKPYTYHPTNPEVVVGETLKTTAYFIDGTNSGLIDQREFTDAKTDRLVGEVKEGLKGLLDPEVKEVTLHFIKVISIDQEFIDNFVMPADIKINKLYLNA